MMTEFVSIQLSREELLEIQEALLQRAMIEDTLRHEEGLEEVGRRTLLDRIEQLALFPAEQAARIALRLDDELWSHSWYSFTDEWAWFRARRDTEKELGEMLKQTPEDKIDDLTHRKYHEKFDSYVREVDMNVMSPVRRTSSKLKNKKPKKK